MRPRQLGTAAFVGILALGIAARPAAAQSAAGQFYQEHDLVSNSPDIASNAKDATLLNAWGLVSGPGTPWWVVNNGDDSSTLYNGAGVRAGNMLRVSVPGGPTGIVFNGGSNFALPLTDSPAARFIFATEGGQIFGWTGAAGTTAIPMVTTPDAVYKGLAIDAAADRIYATNFRAGTVDTFDGGWQPILAGAFEDSTLPEGYAPFGIQVIGATVYVTYALQDEDKEDDVAGVGHGYINAFDINGNLIRRVASKGPLNSPWGIVLAPSNFGGFSNDLLIGNFGDGKIHAFDPASILGNGMYKRVGVLHSASGPPLTIDGLWSLSFGKGVPANGNTDSLYFTAGPNDEEDGLFGFLTAAAPPGQ
jgi:uncharacterized protein (TIGR03118 family)